MRRRRAGCSSSIATMLGERRLRLWLWLVVLRRSASGPGVSWICDNVRWARAGVFRNRCEGVCSCCGVFGTTLTRRAGVERRERAGVERRARAGVMGVELIVGNEDD